MNNSRFSSLIYRIIDKPERWLVDYIDEMHQMLDETESFDDPYYFSELTICDQIISRLKDSDDALTAFNALLDKSRFRIIILDDQLKPIYHNQNAAALYDFILSPTDREHIMPGLAKLIAAKPSVSQNNKNNRLSALNYVDHNDQHIYLRSIQTRMDENSGSAEFHILMALDQTQQKNELNPDLVARYELTGKEQMVLLGLIRGNRIRQIAEQCFISENTVKTHLKAIFRKTGSHSQSAVVGLVLTHESQIMDSVFESDAGGSSPAPLDSKALDHEILLRSGHKIVYCEYGPKDGRPLLVFHSSYGCRLSVPRDCEEICARTHRRLIIPDRPGFGKTPYSDRHPEGWNERLAEFAEQLELSEFDILGSILGCQLAVSYAATGDPRLGKVILTSPVVINRPEHTEYLAGILNPAARLVRASARLARKIYELWLKSISLNPGARYQSMLESSLGGSELARFKQDGTFALLVSAFREAVSRSVRVIPREMVFCISPLEIPSDKLTFQTEVWYGSEDQRISLEGVEQILADFPNHHLQVREGYSEAIYYALLEEIIA